MTLPARVWAGPWSDPRQVEDRLGVRVQYQFALGGRQVGTLDDPDGRGGPPAGVVGPVHDVPVAVELDRCLYRQFLRADGIDVDPLEVLARQRAEPGDPGVLVEAARLVGKEAAAWVCTTLRLGCRSRIPENMRRSTV